MGIPRVVTHATECDATLLLNGGRRVTCMLATVVSCRGRRSHRYGTRRIGHGVGTSQCQMREDGDEQQPSPNPSIPCGVHQHHCRCRNRATTSTRISWLRFPESGRRQGPDSCRRQVRESRDVVARRLPLFVALANSRDRGNSCGWCRVTAPPIRALQRASVAEAITSPALSLPSRDMPQPSARSSWRGCWRPW